MPVKQKDNRNALGRTGRWTTEVSQKISHEGSIYNIIIDDDYKRYAAQLDKRSNTLLAAVRGVMEFWDNNTPVQPGSLAANELRQALDEATR